jgi:hypothetical protein
MIRFHIPNVGGPFRICLECHSGTWVKLAIFLFRLIDVNGNYAACRRSQGHLSFLSYFLLFERLGAHGAKALPQLDVLASDAYKRLKLKRASVSMKRNETGSRFSFVSMFQCFNVSMDLMVRHGWHHIVTVSEYLTCRLQPTTHINVTKKHIPHLLQPSGPSLGTPPPQLMNGYP